MPYLWSLNFFRSLLLALAAIFSAACANNAALTDEALSVTRLDNHLNLNNTNAVKQQLLRQYNEWQGTQYQYGGLSRQGIDCSGFVYVTYRSRLGLDIPRTTELQRHIGFDIAISELRAGDLIFFKTDYFTRHIGIYLGNGQFMHASASRGVTMSNLNNEYWQSKYWLSRRIES